MVALGCLVALNHAGIQAPCDIAIAGFDDIPLARYVHPSLTTMRVDIAELGGRALRALLEGAAQSPDADGDMALARSEEHTSELQSLMRTSYAVFCLKKKTN